MTIHILICFLFSLSFSRNVYADSKVRLYEVLDEQNVDTPRSRPVFNLSNLKEVKVDHKALSHSIILDFGTTDKGTPLRFPIEVHGIGKLEYSNQRFSEIKAEIERLKNVYGQDVPIAILNQDKSQLLAWPKVEENWLKLFESCKRTSNLDVNSPPPEEH